MLTEQEKQILQSIQEEFPLVSRPYKQVGKQLGLSEEEVFLAVRSLRSREVIKRISGTFDSQRLGYRTTVVALQVAPEALEDVALGLKGLHPGITHIYERGSNYNMWFTLTVPADAETKQILEQVESYRGVEEILILPGRKCFKLKVAYEIR